MVLYRENSKDFTQKLLELINKFSKGAGHKINRQKSVVFLCTDNETSKMECKKKYLLKSHYPKIKILKNKPDQGGEKHTLRTIRLYQEN